MTHNSHINISLRFIGECTKHSVLLHFEFICTTNHSFFLADRAGFEPAAVLRQEINSLPPATTRVPTNKFCCLYHHKL